MTVGIWLELKVVTASSNIPQSRGLSLYLVIWVFMHLLALLKASGDLNLRRTFDALHSGN